MKIGYPIKEYFYFAKRERQGFVYFSALCIFFAFLPLIYPLFYDNTTVDFSEFNREIEAFYADDENDNPQIADNIREQEKEIILFDFNPNTASKEDFENLGFSSKAAQTILNYRDKGGKFRKKEDFKKSYSVTDEMYKKLEDYIVIPEENKAFPNKKRGKKFEENLPAEEFLFDPNTASLDDLIRLGISKRTAKGLVKYREAGAVFKKKSDLQRVYNFREADYLRLEKFIDLPDSLARRQNNFPPPKFVKKEKPVVYIDINAATAEEWTQLRGIGPSYARRIVEIREKLGGFADVSQVAEAYKLPDSTYQAILPFLTNENPTVTRIPINKMSKDELGKHPYITWKEAKRITAYRSANGIFKSMDDFRKQHVFTEEFYRKIEPYLSFEY